MHGRFSFGGRIRCARLALLVLSMASFAGCPSASVEKYVPAGATAREALETVLDAWKGNGRRETIYALKNGPKIQAVDQDWEAGKKLAGFEIVQELPGSPAEPKRFAVRLTYADQLEPLETVYHVFGVDPLWVVRAEDYSKTTGM